MLIITLLLLQILLNYIIKKKKIMLNYTNNSKEMLSATVIPKKYESRTSQKNPLNPKNLPVKPLFINIPKNNNAYNDSMQTPKTARNNIEEGKSHKKMSFLNKSISATPEKVRQNKQNSYVNLKNFINETESKQQCTKQSHGNESGRLKTQTFIIPKQIKDITNKDEVRKLRQTISNTSQFKPNLEEIIKKNPLQLNFMTMNSSPYTESNKQQSTAPISFRKKKQLEIIVPSTIKIREKTSYSILEKSKGPKQNIYYNNEKSSVIDKMAETSFVMSKTPRTSRTTATTGTYSAKPRISQDKTGQSRINNKIQQMSATDTTGNLIKLGHQKKFSNVGYFTPRKQKERQSQKYQLKLQDFDLGSCKGQGRFGKVFPARHRKCGMLVAIKQIKKQSVRLMMQQFIQEIKINMYLDHPNVTKTYGFFQDKIYFYILMQYMEQGSLYRIIKLNKRINEDETKEKLYQICSAVKYLHENQILHRDIKPQNIVLTNGVCKLCDFGWAVYSNQRRNTYCGTLDYVCPEILEGQSYDKFVDIWAIGVLAFEMLIGKAPFYHISRQQTMKSIMKCNINFPAEMSERARNFIQKALQKNADNRQSVQYLLKDNFLRDQGFLL